MRRIAVLGCVSVTVDADRVAVMRDACEALRRALLNWAESDPAAYNQPAGPPPPTR